jgi:accessory gene regulator protein AgrB
VKLLWIFFIIVPCIIKYAENDQQTHQVVCHHVNKEAYNLVHLLVILCYVDIDQYSWLPCQNLKRLGIKFEAKGPRRVNRF